MQLYDELTKIIWKRHPLPKFPSLRPSCGRDILMLLMNGSKSSIEIHRELGTHDPRHINNSLRNLQGYNSYRQKIEFKDTRYQLVKLESLPLRERILILTKDEVKLSDIIIRMPDITPVKVRKMVSKMSGEGGKEKTLKRTKTGYYIRVKS
jgi:hypothetical protein